MKRLLTFIALVLPTLSISHAQELVWGKMIGGASDDHGYSIAVDGSGNVLTTGYFMETADFDPGEGVFNFTAEGVFDVFVHKMSPASLSVSESLFENTLLAYPNPAGGDLVIELDNHYPDVLVMARNLLGQKVLHCQYNDTSRIELTLEGEAGIYFITVQAGAKTCVLKVVKE